jgi:hypothetical protein
MTAIHHNYLLEMDQVKKEGKFGRAGLSELENARSVW